MNIVKVALASLLVAGTAHAECQMQKFGTLPVKIQDNRIVLDGQINGHPMKFLVDTAAPGTMLLAPYAHSIGLQVDEQFGQQRQATMEGRLPMGQITLDTLQIDRYVLKTFRATVRSQRETFGQPDLVAVLGNDFLGQFDIEFDLKGGAMTLYKPQGCDGANLAYWTDSYNQLDLKPVKSQPTDKVQLTAKVNGHDVTALLDTGSPFTGLTDNAASDANVSFGSDNLLAAQGQKDGAADFFTLAYDIVNGFGTEQRTANNTRTGLKIDLGGGPDKVWQTSADTLQLDQEAIHPAKLRVFHYNQKAVEIGSLVRERSSFAEGMVLGVDFLLSHRVMVSHSQNKLYFSYTGGPALQAASVPPAAN